MIRPNLIRYGALLTTLAAAALGQTPAPTVESKIAALEAAVKSAQTSGDNAWVLVSSALVLMMTGPGLALS